MSASQSSDSPVSSMVVLLVKSSNSDPTVQRVSMSYF